ncbi:DUF3306 domain-containing protein [Shewanella sp. AS1]|uniref:DUF3306 domain-containing protein n=1 Tax=Shewanella sp. AS1 TaxID=2907626 RepID=UPI001F37B00F|nr:DUF3306 domain-containing protein [Shewanella sp. AS1]MCE9679697.1 DUF3306 domain-containing protein [Shewanella sp. AS1]
MSDKSGGLLARWNLRRQQVQDEELKEQQSQAEARVETQESGAVEAEATQQSVATSADAEKKVLMAEDLPDPEKIEVGGSFASFMADNVDPNAKAAALRALWKQPHYSEIDGLLEYALDYTNQPKLTAEASAELAKKVFRHLIKDEEEQEQAEEMTAASTPESDEELASEVANLAEQPSQDILDGNMDEVPQNEPELQDVAKPPVA